MSNFYIINLDNQKETHFESNEIIIGRQLLENCNDKRISRTHAIIRLDTSGKFFWLIPTHSNPVFHRSFQDVDLLNIITKTDEKIVVRCEDKFGLLSDQHWFKIKQTIDFNTSNNNNLVNELGAVGDNIRVRNVEEVNQTLDIEPEIDTNCIRVRNVEEVNQILMDNEPEVETNSIRVRNVEEVNQSCITPVKRRLPDWMKSPSPNSNKKKKDDSGTSSQAINSPNQIVMASPIQNVIQSNEDSEMVVDPPDSPPIPNNTEPEDIKIKTEIKEEPNATGGTSASTNTVTPTKVIIKKDPDPVPVPVNLRPSCSFGIRCYRRNPAHRSAEAHPGDSDYRRPSFPEPAAGTPPCPFGSQCYRRNPFHFQQFTHPPSTNAKQNRRNLRKTKNTTNLNQNILFSDYDDSDHDFNGDSDSDEYVPGKLDESSESSVSSINSEL